MKKMYKKIIILTGLIFIVSSMTSCVEAVKESQKIIKESQKPELIGKFFPIESQGIKLFLPKEFKRISKADYLKLIEKSEDSTVISYENERLRNLYLSGHDIYLFQHSESGSILSLIPTRYFKFNKADAQMLLNQIKSNHDDISYVTGLSFKKQEARFFETREAQIFKAIYLLKMPEMENDYYKQVYFVSFNKKSFALSLETGFPVNFDPYLEKIRIL